jgi:hypothetical protein
MNFRNKIIFYGEELLAPRPTPKLEDHPLSAVCDCLFITANCSISLFYINVFMRMKHMQPKKIYGCLCEVTNSSELRYCENS